MGKEYVTREDVDKAKRTGGAVLDKLMVAKTRVTSNELERALLKVTSHKLKEVNPKHLGRLVQHTVDLSVPKEDMEYIVTELEKRLHNHEWVVVLKSLVTLHALLKHGSRRICDEIVQKQGLFHISHFKDLEKHSRFIKKYSRYLEERCMTMLHTGCGMRIERPKELASELAVMPTQLALRTTTCLTLQLNVLVGLELATPGLGLGWADGELTMQAFRYVVEDSKHLFVILSLRSLWLLDSYDKLSAAERAQALDSFTSYCDCSAKLIAMFKTLESDRAVHGAVPKLTPLPSETIARLTEHLSEHHAPAAGRDTAAASSSAAAAAAPAKLRDIRVAPLASTVAPPPAAAAATTSRASPPPLPAPPAGAALRSAVAAPPVTAPPLPTAAGAAAVARPSPVQGSLKGMRAPGVVGGFKQLDPQPQQQQAPAEGQPRAASLSPVSSSSVSVSPARHQDPFPAAATNSLLSFTPETKPTPAPAPSIDNIWPSEKPQPSQAPPQQPQTANDLFGAPPAAQQPSFFEQQHQQQQQQQALQHPMMGVPPQQQQQVPQQASLFSSAPPQQQSLFQATPAQQTTSASTLDDLFGGR